MEITKIYCVDLCGIGPATRLSVEFVLNLLAHGATETEILSEYDGLVSEDVIACLLFAAKSLEKYRVYAAG